MLLTWTIAFFVLRVKRQLIFSTLFRVQTALVCNPCQGPSFIQCRPFVTCKVFFAAWPSCFKSRECFKSLMSDHATAALSSPGLCPQWAANSCRPVPCAPLLCYFSNSDALCKKGPAGCIPPQKDSLFKMHNTLMTCFISVSLNPFCGLFLLS